MNRDFILNQLKNIAIVISADDEIILFNEAAEQFYNLSKKRVFGENIFNLFNQHGFSIPNFKTISDQTIQLDTKNGKGQVCSISWQIIKSKENIKNKLEYVLIAQQVNLKSINMVNFLEIIECIPGSLYWKNANGNYLGCNQFMARTAGLDSVDKIIGKTDFDLWPENAENLRTNDLQIMKDGKTQHLEEKVKIHDGTEMYFACVKMPMRNELGEIVGVVCNSLDITHIKNMEAELYEAKIKDERQQEQIQTMQAMAGNIAHELRTPLGSIGMKAQVMMDLLPKLYETYRTARINKLIVPDIPKNYFDQVMSGVMDIDKEIRNTSMIINVLLKNINTKEIDQASDYDEYSMSECIQEALQSFALTNEQNNAIIIKDDDNFVFKGSKVFICHVFYNLLKNALHYIRISNNEKIYFSFSSDESWNYVRVKDTGEGIASEVLPHIFDKLFSKTLHGSGLGLAFCKLVMQSHGGEISCNSELGQFTEFTLKFPKLSNNNNDN